MKKILTAMVLSGVTLLGGSAFAQDDEVQTRFYDFNDMLIDVETVTKLQGVYRESPHVITCSTRSGAQRLSR